MLVLLVALLGMKSEVECKPQLICLFKCKMGLQDCRHHENRCSDEHVICVKDCDTQQGLEKFCREAGTKESLCMGVFKGYQTAKKMAAMKSKLI